MKKKYTFILIFILTNMIASSHLNNVSLGQESVYTSPKITLEINEETNFTVYSTAPLTWELNDYQNFTIYVNSTGIPLGDNITLVSISIYYNIPNDPHRQQARILTPQVNLTGVNQQYESISALRPPSDADEFNITIEIVAQSTSVPDNQLFETQFPGDETYIDIQKDLVLPVINLPGFPNIETFTRWIFIFCVAFVIISLPAIFVASFKIQEAVKTGKMGKKKDGTKKSRKKQKSNKGGKK
ncbi:MAG: hypothetical protein KGD64_11790 [Candidatus Heimdallarchaeota archaeon]|nr:hypothetical protein [Candidatus Heimdallarchaeota archaeon]